MARSAAVYQSFSVALNLTEEYLHWWLNFRNPRVRTATKMKNRMRGHKISIISLIWNKKGKCEYYTDVSVFGSGGFWRLKSILYFKTLSYYFKNSFLVNNCFTLLMAYFDILYFELHTLFSEIIKNLVGFKEIVKSCELS